MVSVIIPAFNEADSIEPVLRRLSRCVNDDDEVLVIVDGDRDNTRPVVDAYSAAHPNVQCLVNTYGRGPANAIRYGADRASSGVIVVTMADGSDDVSQIEHLVSLVQGGAAVACASRYAPGGRQIGGPFLKSTLSRTAGITLEMFAGVGTRDATNSFKAYSTAFIRSVGIDSRHGFEIGIELTAKARRYRQPVAEIPTVWRERRTGKSKFRLWGSLPRYIHWYRFAYGRQLVMQQPSETCTALEPEISLSQQIAMLEGAQ